MPEQPISESPENGGPEARKQAYEARSEHLETEAGSLESMLLRRRSADGGFEKRPKKSPAKRKPDDEAPGA